MGKVQRQVGRWGGWGGEGDVCGEGGEAGEAKTRPEVCCLPACAFSPLRSQPASRSYFLHLIVQQEVSRDRE